jgi:hypothetical protein
MGKPHEAAPAAIGWNVIEYAPPGAVTLSAAQRDDIRRELARVQRIEAEKLASEVRCEKLETLLRRVIAIENVHWWGCNTPREQLKKDIDTVLATKPSRETFCHDCNEITQLDDDGLCGKCHGDNTLSYNKDEV